MIRVFDAFSGIGGFRSAQLYKQAGNAVTVNVVEAIARNLLEFDKEVFRN